MKFQMDFRGVSGVYQIVSRRFSVPLNQILFRRYSEHKSPIVSFERDIRDCCVCRMLCVSCMCVCVCVCVYVCVACLRCMHVYGECIGYDGRVLPL